MTIMLIGNKSDLTVSLKRLCSTPTTSARRLVGACILHLFLTCTVTATAIHRSAMYPVPMAHFVVDCSMAFTAQEGRQHRRGRAIC